MAQRGRKSTAALAVVTSIADHRPDAPYDLTDEQAEEWRAVVHRMPADWFTRETHALLTNYCRAVTRARLLSRAADEFRLDWLKDSEGLERFDRLSRVLDREVRQANALARSLRLTHQARYRPATAATAAGRGGTGRRPWETE